MKFLESYGLMAGWGKFRTSPIALSMGKLVQDVQVTVEDNFFARSGKKEKADSPRCFFVAGLLAGIAGGLLGDHYTCFERACIASGADRCEFIISPRRT